jgi:hypothetical protein
MADPKVDGRERDGAGAIRLPGAGEGDDRRCSGTRGSRRQGSTFTSRTIDSVYAFA